MLDQIRRVRQDESGFTLIELLIVIVVLGVLSTVVVFAVGGIKDRADAAACKSDVKTVSVASEAYNAQFGGYASSVDELVNKGLLKAKPVSTMSYSSSTGSVSATCGGVAFAG